MKLQRLSNEEYHSRPGLSSSDLKALASSPKTWMMERKKSSAMDLGTVFHDFILEGVDRSLVLPKASLSRKTTNEKGEHGILQLIDFSNSYTSFAFKYEEIMGYKMEELKGIWDNQKEQMEKKYLLIDEAQKQALEEMKESFYSHPESASYLNRQDEHGIEESFEVDARDLFDTKLDVKIRVRPDYYNATEGYIVDLKSTKNSNKFDFRRDMWKFGYHASASLYMEVLALEGIEINSYFLLATENKEPHCTEVYMLSDETLAEGWQVILEGWRRYEEYIAGGYFGYHGGVVEL